MSTSQPAYRRIEKWLRELLRDSNEGDLLPTVGDITERFDVRGVQTVRNAYQPLIEEGWVYVRQRPQRRWVVAKVPPRTNPTADRSDELARLARIEDALRGALRELDTLRVEIEVGDER